MIQTSEFVTSRVGVINFIVPTGNFPAQYFVGVLSAGASKAELDRGLAMFDLYGAASVGRALIPGDTIASAELVGNVNLLIGASGFPCSFDRITRDDWVQAEATWNIYKTANNWTTGGGDVDLVTPAAVTFNSPIATGDQTICTGLAAFVTDAIANRSGRVHTRVKAVTENNVDHYWEVDDTTLRLRVVYTPAPTEIVGGRLYVEVYDAAGNKLGAGPIFNIADAEIADRVDAAGDYSFLIPAADERASLLAAGREIRLYREGEGELFRGLVEKQEWDVRE